MRSTIADVMSAYRTQMSTGRIVEDGLRLASTVEPPATAEEISLAWPDGVPSDAMNLWRECRSARLFEDIDYRQWGLHLLAPMACRQRTDEQRRDRSDEIKADDIVIGEFFGDTDLLLLAPSELGDRQVLVAGGIDPRDLWEGVGANLAVFLKAFLAHDGDKYFAISRANPTGHIQASCERCAAFEDHT